jgi:hypothetical protein
MKSKSKKLLASLCAASLAVATTLGSFSLADDKKDANPSGNPEAKLPPGWTEADMKACIAAGTPGKMHEHLAKGVGAWNAKVTMWMHPDTEPMTNDGTSTVTSIMDGRFIKVEMSGEMPGMGPYSGFGIYGYDNVTEKFVSTWIDNHSTGIMQGTGMLSPDGKVLTWTYSHTCPLTKKPMTMREVETVTGPDSRTLEMFGTPPKVGKEFRMMRIELTRKS